MTKSQHLTEPRLTHCAAPRPRTVQLDDCSAVSGAVRDGAHRVGVHAVSLLTPIASDLGITEGQAGQAIFGIRRFRGTDGHAHNQLSALHNAPPSPCLDVVIGDVNNEEAS